MRDSLGLLDHLGRKAMRKLVLADDDLHIHAEIVGPAEDLDHAARLVFVIQQLHVHNHAVQLFDGRGLRRLHADAVDRRAGGRELHPLGDLDPLLDAVVVRDHVLAAAPDAEFAHHRGMGALEHLDNLAIRAAVRFDARDADHHAVAVHGRFRGFARDENVSRNAFHGPVGNQESVTVPVHVEPSHREFAAAGGDGVMPGAQLDQVAARGQAGQRRLHLPAFGAFSSQFANQLLEIGAAVRQSRNVPEQVGVRHLPILPGSTPV